MTTVTVIKLDIQGQESWRYQGKLIERRPHTMIIEAFFDREVIPVDKLILRKGDRFVESYYDDRWFNIYEIFDRDGNRRKGWYCNVCTPAQFSQETITFQDLALDLVVYPDGEQAILDQEEFYSLPLSEEFRRKALEALDELRAMFSQREKKRTG
ncbi:MAG TPA: DUF402 domain-containing protein [Anaerolineales bacterium]|nr:DUF402 domain-containing protein [Anaerolineales bacterium]